jgi:hypothetical protein
VALESRSRSRSRTAEAGWRFCHDCGWCDSQFPRPLYLAAAEIERFSGNPGDCRSVAALQSTPIVAPRLCRLPDFPRIENESGSLLIEALTAAAVVITISTGVALLLVRSTVGVRDAGAQSAAVLLAQQKLEQLSALEWRIDSSGISRSDVTSNLSVDPPDASGSGLQPSPPGTLDRNTPGFADFVGPDQRMSFVRRWSIVPHPGDPSNTIVVTVIVLPAGKAAEAAASSDSVRLQTIRTRTAR